MDSFLTGLLLTNSSEVGDSEAEGLLPTLHEDMNREACCACLEAIGPALQGVTTALARLFTYCVLA